MSCTGRGEAGRYLREPGETGARRWRLEPRFGPGVGPTFDPFVRVPQPSCTQIVGALVGIGYTICIYEVVP
jgi:hypothetical protein